LAPERNSRARSARVSVGNLICNGSRPAAPATDRRGDRLPGEAIASGSASRRGVLGRERSSAATAAGPDLAIVTSPGAIASSVPVVTIALEECDRRAPARLKGTTLLSLGELGSEQRPTASEIRTIALPESDRAVRKAADPAFGPGYRHLLAVEREGSNWMRPTWQSTGPPKRRPRCKRTSAPSRGCRGKTWGYLFECGKRGSGTPRRTLAMWFPGAEGNETPKFGSMQPFKARRAARCQISTIATVRTAASRRRRTRHRARFSSRRNAP
jgi:hypothetical protein